MDVVFMSHTTSPAILTDQIFEFSNHRCIVTNWTRAEIERHMVIFNEDILPNGNVILFFMCYKKKVQHYFVIMDSTQTKILDIGYQTLTGVIIKIWERDN